MKKKILIADDHPMVRKGLQALFNRHFRNFEIVEASSCNETMKKLNKDTYSHLILDMVFADGIILEILPNIVALHPGYSIMIFSMQSPDTYKEAMRQYGIYHCISKTLPESAIIEHLRQFLHDSPDKKAQGARLSDTPFSLLTARELEILHYILKGMGSNEIGNILNIKYNTVSTARRHIYEKTGTGTIRELLELAARYNLV